MHSVLVHVPESTSTSSVQYTSTLELESGTTSTSSSIGFAVDIDAYVSERYCPKRLRRSIFYSLVVYDKKENEPLIPVHPFTRSQQHRQLNDYRSLLLVCVCTSNKRTILT